MLKSKYYDLFEKLDRDTYIYLLRFGIIIIVIIIIINSYYYYFDFYLAQLGLQLPEQYTLRAVATFIVKKNCFIYTIILYLSILIFSIILFQYENKEEFIKFTKTKNYLVEFVEQNSTDLIQIVLIVSCYFFVYIKEKKYFYLFSL